MGGVDEEIEVLLGENAREPLGAAEAAASRSVPGSCAGLRGPPGERQRHVVASIAGKRAGERRGLAAAAENEKLRSLSCRSEVAS